MSGRTLLLAPLLALAIASSAHAQDLAVIVHADRAEQPTLAQIAQIYLKKRRFWSDGDPVVPVNRDAESAPRAFFARTVVGKDLRQLVVYWNREYFRGVLPPATLASDEAVRRFVASEPRAIGYIHPDVVDDSVRVILHLGAPPPSGSESAANGVSSD